MYEELYTPLKIGNLELGNRFVMPPMNSRFGKENDHTFTEQALNYYGERAKGGFGLIITEFLCVSEEGLNDKTQPGIYDDRFIPMLKKLVDRVHQEGAKIIAQLHHSGRMQGYGVTPLEAVGASWLPAAGHPLKVRELRTDEIPALEDKFVKAALRAKEAGFDGVEIHGAHGYLLSQFLSKGVNKRVDKYGGSTSDRARIVCEIIEGVKAACGKDYPVCVRSNGDEGYDGGNTLEDAAAQALLFEQAGADMLHISYGVPIRSYYADAGFNIQNVKWVKDMVRIPVIGVGRFNDPSLMLEAVKSGSMDLVALGRQSLSDPHYPEKLREGRIDEIFTCTGCMQRCRDLDAYEEGFGISCMINPFSGKEGIWEIGKAEDKKKIAIVGAGPGGLQAAWVLAARGHDVTVYEKEKTAGGQYRLASVPAKKQELARTIATYLTLCAKYGAKVIYDTEVDGVFLEKEKPDVIIDATGSVPLLPPIEGIQGENTCLANDILRCEKIVENQKVLVLGAGLVGVETAEFLRGYGNEVTLVDMLDRIAPQAPLRVRQDLDIRIPAQGIRIVLQSKVVKILEDGIVYMKDGKAGILDGFDLIVLAFGAKSNTVLSGQLEGSSAQIYQIGDAHEARDARIAIFEATKLALSI